MYDKLKSMRELKGLKVAEVADYCGISKSYYSQIENGKRRLYYNLAVKISAVFGLKPDDLFYEDTKKLH